MSCYAQLTVCTGSLPVGKIDIVGEQHTALGELLSPMVPVSCALQVRGSGEVSMQLLFKL